MQGNGLEKESWAHLPLLVLFRAYCDWTCISNNRDAYEALVQDLQGSGVAVSHQKYDIFNGDRFPHACCGTVMFMCRWGGDIAKTSLSKAGVIARVTVGPHGRDSAASLTFRHDRRARVEMSFAA